MGQGWREVNRNSAIGMDPNGLVPEALPSPPLAPKERRLACHLVCQIASSMPASSRCRRVFSRRVPPRTAWATPASRSLASRPLSLQVLQALTLHGVLVGAVIAEAEPPRPSALLLGCLTLTFEQNLAFRCAVDGKFSLRLDGRGCIQISQVATLVSPGEPPGIVRGLRSPARPPSRALLREHLLPQAAA